NPIREARTKAGRSSGRRAVALGAVLLWIAFVVQLGATTASAATGDSAALKPPAATGDPVTQEFIRTVGADVINNQEALSVFRAWMTDQAGFADSGYVGTIDDLQHKATTIMWYGPKTAFLSAVVTEGYRRGIAVSVQPRSHSLQQLDTAVEAIWQQ